MYSWERNGKKVLAKQRLHLCCTTLMARGILLHSPTEGPFQTMTLFYILRAALEKDLSKRERVESRPPRLKCFTTLPLHLSAESLSERKLLVWLRLGRPLVPSFARLHTHTRLKWRWESDQWKQRVSSKLMTHAHCLAPNPNRAECPEEISNIEVS